jgi:hypothetical protein
MQVNKEFIGQTEVSTAETSKLKLDSFLKPPVHKNVIEIDESKSLFKDSKSTEVQNKQVPSLFNLPPPTTGASLFAFGKPEQTAG